MEGFYDLGEMRWIPGRWTYPCAGSSSPSGSVWLEALERVPRLLAVVRSAAGIHVSVPSRELVSPLNRRVGRGLVCRRLRRDYNSTNLYSSGLVGPL